MVCFDLRIWRDRMEHALRVFIDAVTRARNSSCEQGVASWRSADDLRATSLQLHSEWLLQILCVFSQCPLDLATSFEAQLTETRVRERSLLERRILRWTYERDKRREYDSCHIHLPPTYIYSPFRTTASRSPKRINEKRERNSVASRQREGSSALCEKR